MTAKEKAKELIDKYDIGESQNLYFQKICALICVDELIKECTVYRPSPESRFDYWQEVKQELNNL